MKKKIIIFVSFLLYFNFGLLSQEVDTSSVIFKKELILDKIFKSLRNSKTDIDFNRFNTLFKKELKSTLLEKEAFTYPFDSLKSMSTITSPDNKFRIFNWNVEMESRVNKFYCFILKKDGRIIELRDNYRNIISPELKILSDKNWYGAVYYEIIKLKSGKYTLLGWNGKDEFTTQKVIEVMSLKRKSIKFGGTIFKYEDTRIRKRRIILKYANDAFVTVKYLETKKGKQIIFSHLSPSIPQMKGHFEYYYPDLSYDKFILERGKWIYKSDTEVKNKKSKQDKNFNPPE